MSTESDEEEEISEDEISTSNKDLIDNLLANPNAKSLISVEEIKNNQNIQLNKWFNTWTEFVS